MKRVLSLVLALSLVLGSIPAGFAATAGETLKGYGLVAGDTSGNLNEDKNITRGEMMVVLARLLNKFEEAKAYSIPSTSKDVAGHWAANYISFAEKEVWTSGMGNGIFAPNSEVTLQQVATFMLKALGYSVTDYAKVVEQATTLGLLKDVVAKDATAKVLRSDVFVAALNTINTPSKDSTVKLGEKLGVLKPVAVAMVVDTVKALTNSKVKVTVTNALKEAPKATEFAIVDKDNKAVAISAVALSTDGKTITLTTDAQVAGALYKLTVAGVTKEYVGLVKDTTKPVVSTVFAKTNTMVEVTFGVDDLDVAAATNVANYVINNDLKVVSATVKGKVVTLTTSAQTNGKLYTATISNVADLSGNVMDKAEVKFGGKAADTTKPAVSTVIASKGNKITVTFTEAEKLDEATALNIANYTVDKDLKVTAAEFKLDANDDSTNALGVNPVVILTTSTQKNGELYTLTTANVKDMAGNMIASTTTKFGGSPVDTVKPAAPTVVAKTNTTVDVTFGEELDKVSAETVANYVFDGGLTATAAKLDTTKKIVTVTTSAQTSGKLYIATITGVKDEAGNTMDKAEVKFGGKAADTTAPTITSATADSRTTVKVLFNEELDKASAETLSNYVIDGGLGYPTSASYDKATKTVTLGTATQEGKVYTITVNGVKDLSMNAIKADTTAKFAGIGGSLSKLQVEGVVTVDKFTIQVLFNQTVDKASAETPANYVFTGGAGLAAKVPNKAVLSTDKKSVTVVFNDAGEEMASTEIYTVTVSGVTGQYGAILDTDKDDALFAGITNAKTDLTVDLVTVIDKRTIEITFSENVITNVAGDALEETKFGLFKTEGDIVAATLAGANVLGADNAAPAKDKISKNKLTLNLASDLEDNTVYYLQVATGHMLTDVTTYKTVKVNDADDKSEAVFATGTVPASKLKLEAATMTDVNTLVLYFNQNVTTGTFQPFTAADIKIKSGATDYVVQAEFVDYIDVTDNKITVYFVDAATLLTAGNVYTVEVLDPTQVKMDANTAITLDTEFDTADFAAVDTANTAPKMVGASVVANNKVKVSLSEAVNNIATADVIVVNKKTGITLDAANYTVAYLTGDDFFTITTDANLIAGTTYEVQIAFGSTRKDAAGIQDVKKNAASAVENSVTFTGAGTVTALTLVDAQFKLEFGTAIQTDAIEATATAGLVATTKYLFKLNGTTAATVKEVYATTAGDKALGETDFTNAVPTTSVAAIATEVLTISVYDVAGNLLGTTGNVTAGIVD